MMANPETDEQHPPSPPPEAKPKTQTDAQRLDEGLEETFPASDPVSAKDIE
jgi:hypothetical protein